MIVAGAGTFFGTAIVTAWGLMKGKKNIEEKTHISPAGHVDAQITGAVIMDNTSMRDMRDAMHDLRDEIIVVNRSTERQTDSVRENNRLLECVIDELKQLRRTL